VSIHLQPLWAIAWAIAGHAGVHALHLVDGALTRREFRRARRARAAAAVSASRNPASKEQAQ
jgi:hypothetical protein